MLDNTQTTNAPTNTGGSGTGSGGGFSASATSSYAQRNTYNTGNDSDTYINVGAGDAFWSAFAPQEAGSPAASMFGGIPPMYLLGGLGAVVLAILLLRR